jgi:iron-sulfur cluster repair protein YtfE (RIC family)
MDAFELLKTDHEKVSQLFKEIESASGANKRNLFTRLKGELDVHAHIEEKILYPALENTEEAREITLEAYEEHKVVKELLAELASGGKINDEWNAKFTVLKENVEHHVEEEEGELFSKARKALSEEEIDRIGADLEAEKTAAQGGVPKAGKTSRAAKSAKRSSTKAANRSAAAGTSGSRGRSSKDKSQAESPGVLKRIANFIGLGDSSTSNATGKRTSKGKSAAKPSSTKGKSASKSSASKATASSKAAKKVPVKAKSGAKVGAKSPAKRSSKKAGNTRATVGAETSRANKRQSASSGRKSAKTASSASSKKAAGRSSTKRKQSR